MGARSNPSGGTPTSLGRRLAVLVVILLALAGAAWAALGFALPPAQVNALVRRQLAATFAREMQFSDVSVGLWPPVRITIRQPELAEPGGFARGVAFRAASVHLDLDVWALLRRRIVIRRLLVDQPALHLVIHADGRTNLDSLIRPPRVRQQNEPMELDVRELTIKNGKVLLDDLGQARRTAFSLALRCAPRPAARP